MTIKNLLAYNNNLDVFLDKKLPIKISFIIAQNKNKINNILEIFEEQRLKLIKRYAVKDDNNEIILDKKGNARIEDIDSFTKEYDKLLNIDENNIIFKKISFSDLKECGNEFFDILTPKEIAMISWMIEEEEEE